MLYTCLLYLCRSCGSNSYDIQPSLAYFQPSQPADRDCDLAPGLDSWLVMRMIRVRQCDVFIKSVEVASMIFRKNGSAQQASLFTTYFDAEAEPSNWNPLVAF